MERVEGWEKLVKQHLAWCDSIASIQHNKCYKRSLLDRDDFIQAARSGLIFMAKKYDPAKNTSFRAFAIRRVVGAIWDSIRQVEGRVNKCTKVDVEGNLIESRNKMRSEMEVSFSKYLNADYTFQGVMRDDFHGTCDLFEHHMARIDLQRLFQSLSPRYQHVVYQYYIMGRKMKDIGADLCIKESRVSQIHISAMNKLKAATAAA